MKITPSTILALALFSGILSLTSCGSNEENESAKEKNSTAQEKTASKIPAACTLFKETDAKAILGDAIQAGMQTSTMCQYVSASEELSKTGENVSLTLHQNAGSEFEKYISDTESSTGIKAESLEGIGEKAGWTEGSLIVKKGNDLFVIMVGKKMEKHAHKEVAKNLATSIISRL